MIVVALYLPGHTMPAALTGFATWEDFEAWHDGPLTGAHGRIQVISEYAVTTEVLA